MAQQRGVHHGWATPRTPPVAQAQSLRWKHDLFLHALHEDHTLTRTCEDLYTMAVLGTTASAAGLLSLAGQCISGAQKLYDLHGRIADASKTVTTFRKDVKRLLRTLADVQGLLQSIQSGAIASDQAATTSLRLCLEDTQTDIEAWLHMALLYLPTSGKGTRAWFRKFWVAANEKSIKDIRSDMLGRRTELSLALATLGRHVQQTSLR
jgi:hypothetical protein